MPADLRGEVPGGRPHRLGLTLRQPAGVPAPTGTSLGVEVSFDAGATWRAVPVTGAGTRYTATFRPGAARCRCGCTPPTVPGTLSTRR